VPECRAFRGYPMLKRIAGLVLLALGLVPSLLEWAEHWEFIEHHVPAVAATGEWFMSHLHQSIPVLCAIFGVILMAWEPVRSWLNRPTFVPEKIIKNETTSPAQYQLMVRNKGEFFQENIVKLTAFRSAGDGKDWINPGELPAALKTITSAHHENPTARFNLSANEPKQVFLCSFNHKADPGISGSAGLHLETDAKGWNFPFGDSSGFAAVIGLFGRTHSECIVYIAVNDMDITSVTLLDKKTEKEFRKRWARFEKNPPHWLHRSTKAAPMPIIPEPKIAIAEQIPDWQIQELFYLAEPGLRAHDSDPWQSPTGNAIKDRLSTGQFRSWGRLSKEGTLIEIPADYWRNAEWSYFFLSPDEIERRDMAHSRRAAWNHSDAPDYWDVQVNRAQAMKLWGRK